MTTVQRIFDRINKGDDLPRWFRAPILLLSTVIFQGLLYMDPTERNVKAGLTIIGAVILNSILGGGFKGVLKYSVIAHLLNFMCNGHPWGLAKKFDIITTSQDEFDDWGQRLQRLGENHGSIAAVAIYGSQVRGEIDSTSDLDVRVVRYPGYINGLIASLLIIKARFLASIRIFPLDIYLLDDTSSLDQLRRDERPNILVDKEGWLNSYY